MADFYAETMATLAELEMAVKIIARPTDVALAIPFADDQEHHSYDAGPVEPTAAHYDQTWREFLLPYQAVRNTENPDGLLLTFLQSAYEAAAELGVWGRTALER